MMPTPVEFPTDTTWAIEIHPGTPGACVTSFPVVKVRETAKAYLLRDPSGREVWVPRSLASLRWRHEWVVNGFSEVYSVTLPVWFVRKAWAVQAA